MRYILLLLVMLGLSGASGLHAQQPDSPPASEADIRKMVASYVEAFNRGDTKSLAEHWSPDAVYLNHVTGEEVVGRAAIAEQFAALFKEQPERTLEVNVDSIQFVSPNVAVEHGTTRFLVPKAEPEEVDYAAVYVKRDGKWLLDRVTDKANETAASHYEHLKDLEWMVGQWTSAVEGADVELDCTWTKNQNFLTRAFKISIGDSVTSGMQVIGWDPGTKAIRSWTFDSNGAFAEATWEQKGGRWVMRNRGTLPDGRTATMTNVMKPIDANAFTWQTIDRTAGDELLPNIDEIKIVRR